MVKTALMLSLLLLAGCLTSAPVSDPRQAWCENNAPRRDATETIPRAELDEINSHNAKGVLWCGWKP